MSIVDHNGSVEYPYSFKTVFDAVMAASTKIDGLELDSADEMSGHVTFKAGISLASWGENIPIQLVRLSNVRTRVDITSTPKTGVLFGGPADFGKNRRNIEKIINAISSELAGKPAEVEDDNTTSTVSAADEILKLKQLLDAGALTQEEFDAQKAKLLSGAPVKKTATTQSSQTSGTNLPKSEQPLVKIESKSSTNIGMVLFIIVIVIALFIFMASL